MPPLPYEGMQRFPQAEWKSAYLPHTGHTTTLVSSLIDTKINNTNLYIYIYQGSSFVPSTYPTLEDMLLVQLLVVSNRLKDPKQKL
jgi:hypothetical protein